MLLHSKRAAEHDAQHQKEGGALPGLAHPSPIQCPANVSVQPVQNQAWTSRHLVSKLPYIQIQLSVDVDGLWRLTPCCSSHLEAVREVLLPIDSRLHPISRIQKALPCSDFLTSILQARLNAADHKEQDSTHLTSSHCKKHPPSPRGWVHMTALHDQAWKPHASTWLPRSCCPVWACLPAA